MRSKPSSSSAAHHNNNNKNKNNKNAPKKKSRKRKPYVPRSFLECQSLTHVVGFPPQNELVTTPVVSDFVKELFLERFVKEIVKPYQPNKNKSSKDPDDGITPVTNDNYYHVMVGGKLVKKKRVSKDKPSDKSTSKSSEEVDSRLAKTRRIWKQNIVIGTNQCMRILETLHANDSCNDTAKDAAPTKNNDDDDAVQKPPKKPSLIVLAKDIYPPTMCSAFPALAKSLGIPLLLLPGKASLELGRALNSKRTSILIFRCGDKHDAAVAGTALPTSNGDQEMTKARTEMASFVSFIKEQFLKIPPVDELFRLVVGASTSERGTIAHVPRNGN